MKRPADRGAKTTHAARDECHTSCSHIPLLSAGREVSTPARQSSIGAIESALPFIIDAPSCMANGRA
jgi:hypothetical protein